VDSSLLGVVVGWLLGLISASGFELWRRRQRRINLAKVLLSEVKALTNRVNKEAERIQKLRAEGPLARYIPQANHIKEAFTMLLLANWACLATKLLIYLEGSIDC